MFHVSYTLVKMCQWLIVMVTFASKCYKIKILLQTLLISHMLLDNVKNLSLHSKFLNIKPFSG